MHTAIPMHLLKPLFFIISAPSGTGKSSLFAKARDILPILTLSVSHTTRAARAMEKEGVDYFFIDRDSFQGMIDRDEFIEWADVYGNYYGTSSQFIEESGRSGKIVVLDIDVQGALQIMAKPQINAVFVFIAPPSLSELERRLKNRGTETVESLQNRLGAAAKELSFRHRYDYVILNEDLDDAAYRFSRIVLGETLDVGKAARMDIGTLLRRLGSRPDHRHQSKLTELLRESLESAPD